MIFEKKVFYFIIKSSKSNNIFVHSPKIESNEYSFSFSGGLVSIHSLYEFLTDIKNIPNFSLISDIFL